MKRVTGLFAVMVAIALFTAPPIADACENCFEVEIPDPDGGNRPIYDSVCLNLGGDGWDFCIDTGPLSWIAGCYLDFPCKGNPGIPRV